MSIHCVPLCNKLKRRKFIQLSSLASLPLILKSCDWATDGQAFEITVFTDIHTGHLVFESQNWPTSEELSTETLIVGGGIAGLAAAAQLKGRDFRLCELSDRLGGTSCYHEHDQTKFAQGAHYDLAYPANYGEEVLGLLEQLNIIEFETWKDSWSFKDQQHIISGRRESRCFINGQYREEVLPAGELYDQFIKLIEQYSGEMRMPTRLIGADFVELNKISFLEFLNQKLSLTPDFIRGLDYHMLDDWGGTAAQVSALAGVHYFACRPYYKQVVDLFSPPEGNGYFINKLASLHQKELMTGHLVSQISKTDAGFVSTVVDIEGKAVKKISSKNVIYAGQKHALKYIMPDQYEHFAATQYAPWLVLNFVLNDQLGAMGYWQNEMLMEDTTFMGFVDSSMQHTALQKHRVLTAYYCLPPESREDLRNAEANKAVIVEKTVGYLNAYFDQDITDMIQHVYIKVMGHAMPVPVPGYLFNDRNENRRYQGFTFAGVDNGRLPLLFEAMDSGIQAVKALEV